MSVIAADTEPHGVTRIFFDCGLADADHSDEVRIACAVAQAAAEASAEPKEEIPRAA
jgi:hypothetical protein